MLLKDQVFTLNSELGSLKNQMNRLQFQPQKQNNPQQSISEELDTSGFPDPDLIIRTSGEQRISGMMPWQGAYSELYFTEKLWPDFNKNDLFEAIVNYQKRERRFGKTSEQLINQ